MEKRKNPDKNLSSFGKAIEKTFTMERSFELMAAQIMMGLEIKHDMDLFPDKWGLTQEQISPQPTDPVVRWAFDHIGDIWEISAGFTAMRLGFVVVNEVSEKTIGKKIPDDACFWASLMTTWTVKAVHSMGWISLFHIHDHMDHPVPEMIFGQAVAAIVLASTHYAVKHRESIKDLAMRSGTMFIDGVKYADDKIASIGGPRIFPKQAVVEIKEDQGT